MKTVIEIERRWIVLTIDPDIRHAKSKHIVQGYLNTPPGISARVRITNNKRAEFTKKTGTGLERPEETQKTDLESAHFWLDERFADIIQKRRYLRDGWEIDFYEGPLAGLVKAEFEMPEPDFPIQLPPWIELATEVTDIISDRLLACVARGLPAKNSFEFGFSMLEAARRLKQMPDDFPWKSKVDCVRQTIIDFHF